MGEDMLDNEMTRGVERKMSSRELRRKARERIESLSPERLQVAIDFLSYLEERESNEATDELLRIPGFRAVLDEVEKSISERRLTDWRKIRTDV